MVFPLIWVFPVSLGTPALVLARDFVYSGMNFFNVLRFFAGEAIFSNDELGSQSDSFLLGSQSGSFLPATEYFF